MQICNYVIIYCILVNVYVIVIAAVTPESAPIYSIGVYESSDVIFKPVDVLNCVKLIVLEKEFIGTPPKGLVELNIVDG